MAGDRSQRKHLSGIDGFIVPEKKSVILPTTGPGIRPAKSNTSTASSEVPASPTDKPAEPKKSRKRKLVVLSVIGVVVIVLGLGLWDAWQLYHKLHKLNVGNLTASVGGAENILVAGSTNRCNLSVQNAEWGFCSQGVTGVNSDIIFIVHLVPSTNTMSVLSIPRDTFIPDARSGNQAFKIDAALYQGPTQLVEAVEQDFGIPIQHYMEVGFDGFVNIVNAVGGVKMDFPMPVYDADSYLNIKAPGCYLLNGLNALQVVRARHLQYKPATVTTNKTYDWPMEPASDLARIVRTHEFLKVLASTVAAKGLSNPITDQKLIDAAAPNVQVDSGFSTSSMLQLAQDFKNQNINNLPEYTLPVATPDFGTYYYNNSNMGDVVFPAGPNDSQLIDQFLGNKGSTNPFTGKTLPKPSTINVNVINGSGVPNQATSISNGLKGLGFNIVSQPGDTTPASSQAQETVVYYASRATEGQAIMVASKLSGYVILSQNASKLISGSTITVITGTGAAVNAPASSQAISSGSATAKASSSSTSSSSSNSSLGSISSADQSLSAWDPRACTANQPLVN